jgi:hypothetical protein
MSFATDGFLSPTIDRFRASLKNVYKAWFDYAKDFPDFIRSMAYRGPTLANRPMKYH